MEDTYCHLDKVANDPSCGLFAVFDGHGGPEIAIFCKITFPTILEWNMKYFIQKDEDYI